MRRGVKRQGVPMLRLRTEMTVLLGASLLLSACQARLPRPVDSVAPDVFVVPTLGNDHQFNLDYTVAHLGALLDAIAPDAVVIPDFTDWLGAGCVFGASAPEHHVALDYAQRHAATIWGTRTRPSPAAYERDARSARVHNERYDSAHAVARDYRD